MRTYINNNIWHLHLLSVDESKSREDVIQRTRVRFPAEGLEVAFFATGPSLRLIMYIFRTLEFPTHNFNVQHVVKHRKEST